MIHLVKKCNRKFSKCREFRYRTMKYSKNYPKIMYCLSKNSLNESLKWNLFTYISYLFDKFSLSFSEYLMHFRKESQCKKFKIAFSAILEALEIVGIQKKLQLN